MGEKAATDVGWQREEKEGRRCTFMGMYEEIDKETMELLLSSLAERTLSGKQKWEGMDYKPISFVLENEDTQEGAFISQMFEMETEFKGRSYTLEVMEQVSLPSGKGDISGSLAYEGDVWGKYDFALCFDEKYQENGAQHLGEAFAGSPVVKLMDAVVSVFQGSEAESRGFSYARYFNQEGIAPKWKKMPLVKLGERLMEEKRMQDFHRIVLDTVYREELLGECQCLQGGVCGLE